MKPTRSRHSVDRYARKYSNHDHELWLWTLAGLALLAKWMLILS